MNVIDYIALYLGYLMIIGFAVMITIVIVQVIIKQLDKSKK